ncbi:hypothetical protein E1A91_A06G155100v1 [Gossypium mustelinum]|uniref:Uncharacterized protein n=1 Tax=Gossypium mustelinum TaxID=34275 RepID=A0A5D2YY86_GOSMU|nr:hypothetical protein E1A91_A06G155100v1 [Gossypium mustelinum]
MLDLKENPKLDLASSNEISTQKISVPDHISGFQYTADKLDSFVIDMDSFSHGGLNKEINQNPRITRGRHCLSFVGLILWSVSNQLIGSRFTGNLYAETVIRRLLLSTLDDPNRKLCTAISMAVGAIAVYD